jgi:hypothetical protein
LLWFRYEVGKNRNFLYSWLPIGTYHQNGVIWKNNSLKSGELGPLFPWQILCIGGNLSFQVRILRKFTNKRNIGWKARLVVQDLMCSTSVSNSILQLIVIQLSLWSMVYLIRFYCLEMQLNLGMKSIFPSSNLSMFLIFSSPWNKMIANPQYL